MGTLCRAPQLFGPTEVWVLPSVPTNSWIAGWAASYRERPVYSQRRQPGCMRKKMAHLMGGNGVVPFFQEDWAPSMGTKSQISETGAHCCRWQEEARQRRRQDCTLLKEPRTLGHQCHNMPMAAHLGVKRRLIGPPRRHRLPATRTAAPGTTEKAKEDEARKRAGKEKQWRLC